MSHEGALFPNVKSVLVVLSSRSMAFDQPSLRNYITYTYPGSAVFFISTSGDPVGVTAPSHVDLVIDLTEPGARQGFFFSARIKRRGKHTVGRAAKGIFGGKGYHRLFDETKDTNLPKDYMDRERAIQKKVLELAGIEIVKQGGVTVDLSKDIALTLPPMQNR